MPKLSRRSRILLILAVALLAAFVIGSRLVAAYVDYSWYVSVGYQQVFTKQVVSRLVVGLAGGVLLAGALLLNLWIAYRLRPVFLPVTGTDDPLSRYRAVISGRAKLFAFGIPAVVGIIGALVAQGDWQIPQLFLHSVPFGVPDPVFGHDVSFYTFQLPFYRWLLSWAFVAVTLGFFGALVTHYVFGGIRLAGRAGQLSAPARIQLAVVAGLFVLLKAVDYFFDRYDLLLSQRKGDLFTGATYTDLNAVMPANLILLCIAVFCAAAFFAAVFMRNLQIPALATVLLVLSSVLVGAVWPAVLEQVRVSPNADVSESTPIQRNIAATRSAYGIGKDKVDIQDFPARDNVTAPEVAADKGTVPNIRLLDPNLLSATFTQLTQQFNFYGYPPQLDVDRYRNPDGTLRDYLVAAREINTDGLAANQQSWINRHMVYTHGNGFVSAPANQVDTTPSTAGTKGGYPVFNIADVKNGGNSGNPAIQVNQPRIYFGELAHDYAIVGARPGGSSREYDTPGQANTYDGKGGVPIGNWFDRMVFASYYGERNILFNQQIGPESKILYNRTPLERVQKAAPWLKLDHDPYPAVVDGRVKWIVDGYTTLDNYPYSQQSGFGQDTNDPLGRQQPDQRINYIRNSVKATVDAYDGTVNLYSVDDKDPVLKAWEGVFPGAVKPSSAISPDLRQHFRYPTDLFKVQRAMLAKYHVDDPRQFYASQGFWQVPQDPHGSPTPQPPYYVLAQAPGQTDPRFQLTSALTSLRRQNLGAWVTVSSDPRTYGKITVLRVPTAAQTAGPDQVQNQMESTPKVTEDRTLFNNQNVTALFGNLLTLPVSGGLLYVEPVYIQRKEGDSYPQLARVLVSFGGNVGFAESLPAALDQVFGPGAGSGAPGQGGPPPAQPPAGQPPQQGLDPQLRQAVADINGALERLRAAQQSGNFADIGAAQQQLAEAAARFQQSQGR
jgi:uncharacterized membrane protein (UPF0182 family)